MYVPSPSSSRFPPRPHSPGPVTLSPCTRKPGFAVLGCTSLSGVGDTLRFKDGQGGNTKHPESGHFSLLCVRRKAPHVSAQVRGARGLCQAGIRSAGTRDGHEGGGGAGRRHLGLHAALCRGPRTSPSFKSSPLAFLATIASVGADNKREKGSSVATLGSKHSVGLV